MENQTSTNQLDREQLFHPEMPQRLRSLITNAISATEELQQYLATHNNHEDEEENPATYCALHFSLMTNNGVKSLVRNLRVMSASDVQLILKRMAVALIGDI